MHFWSAKPHFFMREIPQHKRRGQDDYYVLSYPPKRRRTIATDFILDFKNNNEEAVTIAAELILAGVKKIEPILKQYLGKYVVSVPPSRAQRLNIPCERVCMAIERDFDWLRHLPGALRRTTGVRKSAYAQPHERPTYEDHLQSIEYSGAVRATGKSIVMLDDVRTQGNVSSACRDILVEKTGCQRVIGIFLGRTA
jgi:predicted amidophosphoribosyltransferase